MADVSIIISARRSRHREARRDRHKVALDGLRPCRRSQEVLQQRPCLSIFQFARIAHAAHQLPLVVQVYIPHQNNFSHSPCSDWRYELADFPGSPAAPHISALKGGQVHLGADKIVGTLCLLH
jgi:hypothetical protein